MCIGTDTSQPYCTQILGDLGFVVVAYLQGVFLTGAVIEPRLSKSNIPQRATIPDLGVHQTYHTLIA